MWLAPTKVVYGANYGEKGAPVGDGLGEQHFYKIVDYARAVGQPFEDPFFPADESSMKGVGLRYGDGTPIDVKWCRPVEIAKALFNALPKFGVFNEFAVKQGFVGDCWFLSVLADAALEKDCINTLVPADNASVGFDSGAFHFRFWCKGKWVDITIDDRLPCQMSRGKLVTTFFCKPTADGGFWASLLEKAYAKMYSNYGNIDGGSAAEAMLDFTGGVLESYYRIPPLENKIPNCLQHLRDGIKDKAIIAAGTVSRSPPGKETPPNPNNPGSEHVSSEGIVCQHAYSIHDLQDVPLKADPNQSYTLVKARNPWGTDVEWKGAFSDKDDANWATLTRDLRREATDKLADGEFWIPFHSLDEYIDKIDICRWSGSYRGNESVPYKDGQSSLAAFGNFSSDQAGKPANAGVFATKKGYYVNLKARDTNFMDESKGDGFNYNCKISVEVVHNNYTKSGTNPQIPEFGYYLLWAPNHTEPDEQFFFDVKVFTYERTVHVRRITVSTRLPEGTALVVPWTAEPNPGDPFFLRIYAEGEILGFNQ